MSESSPEVLRAKKQTAKGILSFLASQPEAGEQYYQSERNYREELFDMFGSYDAVFLARIWKRMKRNPGLVKDTVLKSVIEKILKDAERYGRDESTITEVIQYVDPAFVPVKRATHALNEASDAESRESRLSDLKKWLVPLLERQYMLCSDFDEEEERLTLEHFDYKDVFSVRHGNSSSNVFSKVAEAIQRANFEIRAERFLGKLDRNALAADTLLYGAKGANLKVLEQVAERINTVSFRTRFQVPPYTRLGIAIFDKWKKGEDVSADLKEAYEWLAGREALIRSSAVYSEDAESATGAGIYETVSIDAEADFAHFKELVEKVYASVNSPEALRYRDAHGIPEEKMGVVIQEFKYASAGNRGYANSVLKNVPELMEISYADGLRPLVIKEDASDSLWLASGHGKFFHYQVDGKRKSPYEVKDLSRLVLLLERYYGQPIQVEFVEPTGDDEIEGTHLVQARFLPKSFEERISVEFPEEEPLFKGRAVGVFDVTLPVLSNNLYNEGMKGAVIFHSSKYYSMENSVEEAFPESGGVIVLGASVPEGGHIETLSAEKGLALIFNEDTGIRDAYQDILKIKMGLREGAQAESIDSLDGYRTVRMVSNGLEGRVYGVEEKYDDELRGDHEPRGL